MNYEPQIPLSPRPKPLLVILSGPSGVGKDAVITKMKELGFPFYYAVTATTRPRRTGEQDGIDYYFLSEEEFHEKIKANQLLEWAKVYGNYYGVPKKQLDEAFKSGQDVIVKVDVQGAATIKQVLPEAVFIFLMPPSMEELERRLRQRHSESLTELTLRLETAREEMKSLALFDYAIVNYQDKLDATISQINAIANAEKCRVKPRALELR